MNEPRIAARDEAEAGKDDGVEVVAREELRRIVADLSALSFRLVGVAAILPRAACPGVAEEVEAESSLDDLRTTIACVLFDHFDSALGALRQALDPARTGGAAPSLEG